MKYYLHDTRAFADEKITKLFMEFGYEGIGLFYTILERLAMQEKPIAEEVLKTQLYIKKRLQKQLSFMYKIGILSLKNGQVFNEKVLKNNQNYLEKREKTRKRVAKHRSKQENVTRYSNAGNASKENKSNINKTKENKEIYKEIDERFQGVEFLSALKEFYQMRNKIKKPMTDRAKDRLLNRLSKIKDDPVAVLNQSCDKDWQDVYPVKNEKNGTIKERAEKLRIDVFGQK